MRPVGDVMSFFETPGMQKALVAQAESGLSAPRYSAPEYAAPDMPRISLEDIQSANLSKPVLASQVMGLDRGYADMFPKFVDAVYDESRRRYGRALTTAEVNAPLIRFATELSQQPSLSGISPETLLPLVRKLAEYVQTFGPVIETYKNNRQDPDAGMAIKNLSMAAQAFTSRWLNDLMSLNKGSSTAPTSRVVPTTVVLPPSSTTSTPSTGTSPLTIAAIGFGVLKLLAII